MNATESVSDATSLHLVDLRDGIATVTLNRPEVLNALNHAQKLGLAETFGRLDADDQVRVVVIRGAGRSFCAGQDQRENAAMDAQGAHERMEDYRKLFTALRRIGKPVIAQVCGHAAGAGLQIALLADLRIASRDAKLGMTELNMGSPCITGSGIMWPIVGEATTKRMVLMADFVDADQALALGLVHEVVEDNAIGARVAAIAQGIAAKPEVPVRLSKQWWQQLTEEHFNKTMDQALEAHAVSFRAGSFTRGAREFIGRKGK